MSAPHDTPSGGGDGVRAVHGAVLRDLSHDMRSPLNAIGGFAELLMADADPATAGLLQEIVTSARSLTLLADAVLDLGRLADGTLVPARRPVMLGEVVEEVADLIGPRGTVAMAPGSDIELLVDPEILARCFATVLRSPAKAGLGTIVRAEPVGSGAEVGLDWSADGEARCAPTALDRARAIGLASVHGATLGWVGEPRSTGATLTIPALDGTDRRRVLYVEDDAAGRALMQSLAARLPGLDLVIVDSLEDARRALATCAFDAVVLDLVLPDGSGLELVQTLRRRMPEAAVAVLTADDRTSTREAVDAARPDAYFTKPTDLGALTDFLRIGRPMRVESVARP